MPRETNSTIIVTVQEPNGEIKEIKTYGKAGRWSVGELTLVGFSGTLMLYGFLLDDNRTWYPPHRILKVEMAK